MDNNNIQNGILASLYEVARMLTTEMTNVLSSGKYPPGRYDTRGFIPIQDSIVIDKPESKGDESFVIIRVGNKSAPYARAYEYGSGNNSRASRGNIAFVKHHYGNDVTRPYKIFPRNKKFMKFTFGIVVMPSSAKLEGAEGIGNYDAVWRALSESDHGQIVADMFWKMVEHPGVEAKPYIYPSIKKIHPDVKKKLAQSFKTSILAGTEKRVIVTNVQK